MLSSKKIPYLEIILTILYTLLFVFLILKIRFYHIEGIAVKAVVIVFLLKVLAGITMYFIYTYYYTDRVTADIFKYFDDSKVMFDALWNKPTDFFKMIFSIQNNTPYFDSYYHQMHNWYRVYESNIYNDSHTIIRINALMRVFSFGYFNVHTVFMCFLSLTGLIALYRFMVPFMTGKLKLLFIAVFLIPSVLFWGSGVLKEAILLFAMGMMLYTTGELLNKKQYVMNVFWLALSLLLLLYIKYYIFITIIPLTIGLIWCRLTSEKRFYLKYGLILVICIIIGFNIHHIFPDFNMMKILAMKQNDFVGLALSMKSGSLITDRLLQPTFTDIIFHVPISFFSTLVMPHIFESDSVIMILAALENIVVILIMIICLLFASKEIKHKSVFTFCLLFFISLYTLTGLTTPVIGAMVRYKIPAMPFMMVFLFMIVNPEKLKAHLPFLAKFIK